jgi:hypothetical protein
MPLYPFIDEATGETVELMYSMSEAPSIGTTVEVDGRVLMRVVADYQIDPATNRSQYPYVSSSLPRNLEGCTTNSQGKPVIMSRRHEREVMSRHGYAKE